MSLLLDALKRAEQEKQARRGERDMSLASGGAPRAAFELQPMPPSPAPAKAEAAPAPTAAQKMPSPAPSPMAPLPAASAATSPSPRRALWIAGSAIAVLVVAGIGYVWHTVANLVPGNEPVARRPAPPAAAAAAAPAPSSVAAAPKPQSVPAALAPLRDVVRDAPAAPRPAQPSPPPVRLEATEAPMTPTAEATHTPAVTLTRSEGPRVPPDIAAGYTALRNGDLAAARGHYAAALASNPRSVDALLGLATIEARAGSRSAATAHYRKVLELDPRNAAALAGLAVLADSARPDALEAQLRADLVQHPREASLHYTLGNLLAAQGRWSQAQAAYFEAHRLDPGNPDILYNLAVSLDHLGQSRLAAEFYGRALDAAKGSAAQFDAGAAGRRLAELTAAR